MSKPYLSLNDQLKNLKGKQIYIGNKAIAKRILTRINFQRFLAYRIHFLDSNKNIKQTPVTKVKSIYRLHEFDRELRDLTSNMLEGIEINFRRHIAYVLGEDDIHSYKDPQYFRDATKHLELLNTVKKHTDNARRSSSGSSRKLVQHHVNNHNDDLPIYKVVEILTFGELSKLFENLKKAPRGSTTLEHKDKIRIIYQQIQQNYKINNQILESWLRDLVEVRNKCAHYDMVWDYQKQLKFLGGDTAWIRGIHSQSINRTATTYKFYGICLIFKSLCLNKKEFKKYMFNIEKLFKRYSNIIVPGDLGFPPTWKKDLNLI